MAEGNVNMNGYGESSEAQGNEDSVANCKKAFHHDQLIHVSKFSVTHLPPRFRDMAIVSAIYALARLVVMIQVPAEGKPDNEKCSHSVESFEALDADEARKATGRIKYVEMVESIHNQVCSCPECQSRPVEDRETEFSRVVVVTATHNICNVDITKLVCRLNYDDMGDIPVDLYCCSIKTFDVSRDRCELYCDIHDVNLRNDLFENIKSFASLNTSLYEKYRNQENLDLLVIISHPHGLEKRVSVGKLLDVHTSNGWLPNTLYTQYFYGTPTCRGSSGAPVYVLGREKVWTNHPHWGYHLGRGFSAHEWEDVTDNLKRLIKTMAVKK
ncbi:uncharacterized protein LOC131933792 [Physella acuta]|uniref:uncharacterized protein LOC131933792 n=1 Tax=Physella acuta TaxID=109671 RepID=UPI0027DD8044|nr:uncharacterized protein LOC131933792 [Physella acuta]